MKLLITLAMLCTFSLSAQAQEPSPNWLIFTDELDNFIDIGDELHERGLSIPSPTAQKKVEEMIEIGMRVAEIYFIEINSDIRPDLESYLNRTIKSNNHLRNYFVLLGNAFLARAEIFQQEERKKDSSLRMWSTVGGTVLGLATGVGILYFKPNLVKGALKSTVLIVGLGAAGAAVGYGGGYVASTFVLPVNAGVETAEEFLLRYPSGEDFISDLEDGNEDIAEAMNDIEEMLNDS